MKFHLVRFFFSKSPRQEFHGPGAQQLSLQEQLVQLEQQRKMQSETIGAVLHARGVPGGLLGVVSWSEYLLAFGAPHYTSSALASSRRDPFVCCEITLQREAKYGKWVWAGNSLRSVLLTECSGNKRTFHHTAEQHHSGRPILWMESFTYLFGFCYLSIVHYFGKGKICCMLMLCLRVIIVKLGIKISNPELSATLRHTI